MSGKLLKPLEILVIDAHVQDTKKAVATLAATRFDSHVHVVRNGRKALSFLRQEREYQDARPPDLIFLDLTLMNPTSLEVIASIKADPRIRHIPVVVMGQQQHLV